MTFSTQSNERQGYMLTTRVYCFKIHSNLDDLQIAVDFEMDKISNWMVVNKLTINPKKSSILTLKLSIKGTSIHVYANINGHQINSRIRRHI